MANKIENFDNYFDTIRNQQGGHKIGELENKEATITNIAEHKSQKSGKTSLQLTINVDGTDISSYMGYATEKAREITMARLTKLSIAAIGVEATKKVYEGAMNSEDNETDEERITDYALKIGKKLRKAPANVIVNRKKTEDGFWDTSFRLSDDNAFMSALRPKENATNVEQPPVPGEAKTESSDDFLSELK
jgi:hypothetical protein